MLTEFRTAIRPAIVLLLLFTVLLGLLYPAAITGVAQVALPFQANGSLEREGDRIVGSALIGQSFESSRYFRGRLSAAGDGYNASASSGSNLSPASKDLRDRIEGDIATMRAAGMTGTPPADLVTTSASGLDPHISPEAAFAQVASVATARGLPRERVQATVEAAGEHPIAGFLGEDRVNVLLLNRQLDRLSANQGR